MASTKSTIPRHSVLRAWMFELLNTIFLVALIVAIAVTLAAYNGKPAPDWGQHLNLNALLALLSTFLRAAIAVMVSQIISQRKWHYFSDITQPLSHLQRFDTGSRGSLGALSLIPTVIFKDFIALAAAVVMLVSFLVGPFVQQASRTIECSFAMEGIDATIPYAHYIPRRGGYELAGTGPFAPPANLTIELLSSATAPEGIENKVVVNCPSGNCTFSGTDVQEAQTTGFASLTHSIHSTVGMCSSCINATSLVTYVGNTKMLPNNMSVGISVNASNVYRVELRSSSTLDWMGELLTEEAQTYARWAYINATLLVDGVQGESATVCSLYPCLRTYNTTFIKNDLSETLIRSSVMGPEITTYNTLDTLSWKNTYTNYASDYVAADPFCEMASTLDSPGLAAQRGMSRLAYYGPPSEKNNSSASLSVHNITTRDSCIFRHGNEMASAIATGLSKNFFNAKCWAYRTLICGFDDISLEATIRTLYNDGNTDFTRTTQWFDSFANSMTNRFRSEYGSATQGLRGELPLDVVHGLAWQTTVCIAMHWHWLLLPIILTAISILLLALSIIADWRRRDTVPVWKEGILPYLFYPGRFEDNNGQSVSVHTGEGPGVPSSGSPTNGSGVLMEALDMSKKAQYIAVRINWYGESTKYEKLVPSTSNDALKPAMAVETAEMRRRMSLSPRNDALQPDESSTLMGRQGGRMSEE